MEKVASEARRIGYWRYENKREKRLKKAMWRAGDTRIQCGTKKAQPLRAALSDFKNYTLKRK